MSFAELIPRRATRGAETKDPAAGVHRRDTILMTGFVAVDLVPLVRAGTGSTSGTVAYPRRQGISGARGRAR